ncbi:MAG: aspartate dehydrogenase [Verrucomicrobiae bacterium]|nr:aspartate dehydrogenase [Verrucomicrobiae bacterium]
MPDLKRVGIVGCGAIGSQLAHSIQMYFKDRVRLIVLCDRHTERAQTLSNELNPHPDVLPLESVPFHCDLVIECASPAACQQIVPKALEMGRDVMALSVGGLVEIYEQVYELAKKKNARLYVPSGAIAGIDGLQAAMTSEVTSVCLTTRKPAASLVEAPYVKEKNLDLSNLTKETVVFDGTAREAVKAFPFNVNVAATLSLAGVGFDKTRVRLLTGPNITCNIHEVEIVGAFGRMTCRTENVPSPANPKTSYLTLLSTCAMLNEILCPVQLGT